MVAWSSLALGLVLLIGARYLTNRKAGGEHAHDLRAVIGAASSGVLLVNDDHVEMVNEQLVQLVGRTEADLLGRDVGELLGASGEERFHTQIRAITQGEQATPVRLTLPQADGGVVDVEMTAIALGDEPGSLLLKLAETTTLVADEPGLREGDQRFRDLCEAVPALLLISSEDRRPLLVNRALCEALGYSEQEVLSMRPGATLVHPEDRARASEFGERVRRGEPVDAPLRCRVLRKDGHIIVVDVRITVISLGDGGRALLSLSTEVTDTAPRGGDVVDAMTVPIGVWNRRGKLIHCNAALLALSGYTVPQLAEMSPLDLVMEDYREHLSADIKLARSGAIPSAHRYELAAAGGDARSVAISVANLDFAEERGALLLQMIDIGRYLETVRRLEKLEKLESVAVSGVIHDFGNLVTAIVGNIEFAELESDPGPWLERAKQASLSAADLVRCVLRSPPGQQAEVMDLSTLAAESVDLVRVTSDPRIEFRVSCPEQGPYIAANRPEIARALMNVLTNARDAVQERLRREDSDLRPPHISVEVGTRSAGGEDYAEVAVTDSGIGMSPEHRERMFDPLFTTKGDGTGLGMVSVSRIVAEHSGTVTVDSTENEGTTVKMQFPCVAPLTDAEAAG